jgi:hypothetical protein
MSFDKGEYQRDYMRRKRLEKSNSKSNNDESNRPLSNTMVETLEKPQGGRFPDRSYDAEGGLILFEYQCDHCKRIYGASIRIPCPYCKKAA